MGITYKFKRKKSNFCTQKTNFFWMSCSGLVFFVVISGVLVKTGFEK